MNQLEMPHDVSEDLKDGQNLPWHNCNNVYKRTGTISQAAVLFISHTSFLKI